MGHERGLLLWRASFSDLSAASALNPSAEIHQHKLERLGRWRIRHPPCSLPIHRRTGDPLQAPRHRPASAQPHRAGPRHGLVPALGHDRRVWRRGRKRVHLAGEPLSVRGLERGGLGAHRLFARAAHRRVAAQGRSGALAPRRAARPRERSRRSHREAVGSRRARLATRGALRSWGRYTELGV